MATILRRAAALALLLPLAAVTGCPFHEETFHQDCTTPADCHVTNPCVEAACNAGVCETSNKPSNTLCSSDSMNVCDGEGHCVECVSYADCATADPTKPICDLSTHTCVSCTDGIKNGKETGVDCGGPDCGACLGAPCVCSSDFTPSGCMMCTTEPPGSDGGACVDHPFGDCGNMTTCAAQERNPDNVCCDMPCTGLCMGCVTATTGMPTGTCAPVPFGMDPYMDCQMTGTPTAGGCGKSPGTCACGDGVQDGSETDVDCGGGTCQGCGGGKKCNGDPDCDTTFPACVGGICCDMNCVGECTGCNSMGQCIAIPGKTATMCTNGTVCGFNLNFPCVGTAGAMCSPTNLGEDCLSGTCQSSTKTCAKSGSGGACNTTADCATGTCTNFVCM